MRKIESPKTKVQGFIPSKKHNAIHPRVKTRGFLRGIKVNLGKRSYEILIGHGILKFIGPEIKKLNLGRDAYIITNALINRKYGTFLTQILSKSGFSTKVKLVADSETSKSIQCASNVIKNLAAYDKKKRIFIVSFGGGVIGDLAGFVASIYKRGIPYIQIPTTLLAQVDSSIGGKTAVDLNEGKNLVGAFYQPKLVFIDTSLLKTLSKRQLKSGLAEVIKYAVIKDPYLFNYLESNYNAILNLKSPAINRIIERCANIKAEIIQKDEREEKGLRTILNFGHTIGHAIEAAAKFKTYNHGEAIALGMLVAIKISQKLNLLKDRDQQKIEKLINNMDLPIKIKDVPLNKIIKRHYSDKKFLGEKNRFVLLEKIGKTKIIKGVPEEIIRASVKDYCA